MKKTKSSLLGDKICPSIFRIPAVQEGCEPLVMMRYTNQVVLGLMKKRGRLYLIDGFGISTPVENASWKIRTEVLRWLAIVALERMEVCYCLSGPYLRRMLKTVDA
uniref:Uncharacterized protein n=1 Tax=viral metagenome TaxID=1070528 RepID=A0A6H2A3N2_9ZZZZ